MKFLREKSGNFWKLFCFNDSSKYILLRTGGILLVVGGERTGEFFSLEYPLFPSVEDGLVSLLGNFLQHSFSNSQTFIFD